ncbi:MAG: hypothetical protein ACRD0S_08350, partial [Acidimicrobiales bacterium]
TSGGTTVRSPRPSKGGGGSTAPATTPPTLSSLAPSGRGDTQPGAVPAPGGSDPGTPTPPADGRHALEHEVDALTPFVQDTAGHTFKAPVPVVILSDTQFLARYDQLNWHPKGADAEQLEAVYRALGLIDANVDLASELAKLSRTEVVTLYDPVAGELLIRNREADPYLRTMLVHELTRALDDQHFDIYRPSSAGFNDESLAGLKALAEGDATRVTDKYTATLSASDRSRVDSERQRIAQQAPSNINRAVKIRFTYFVAQGVNLVKAILGAGGRGRLDAAFAAPPVSSEQILEPSKYLANDAPRAVAEPAAGGPVVNRGVLGQVGVYLMLAPATDDTTANKAAYGWGGDRYVSWQEGPKTCVRQTIVTDSAEDAAELGAALEQWRQKMPGAEVSGSGPFTIKRCA